LGVFAVGFGGGERLLDTELPRVVEILSTGGVDTHVTTNGWFLTPTFAARFAEAGLGTLLVSVDGSNSALHDAVRKKSGSFERACAAMEIGAAARLRVEMATVLTAETAWQLDDLVGIAERHGAVSIAFKWFRPAGEGLRNKERFLLDAEGMAAARRRLEELRRRTTISLELFQPEASCSCGVTQLTLRPNGDVAMCPYEARVLGNILDDNLLAMWAESDALMQRRSAPASCLATHDQRAPLEPVLG
jgi:MoaA/NifB/PqqE/SkfB family radical SAM enzyme